MVEPALGGTGLEHDHDTARSTFRPVRRTPATGAPESTRDEMRDLGRLRRSATDRKVAGVAGGLARHLDVDPLILRVAFVVLAFFGGAGLILYGACWLLVPDEETGEARRHPRRPEPHAGPARRRCDRRVRPDRRLVGRVLVPVAAGDHRAGRAVLRDPQGPADAAARARARRTPHRRRRPPPRPLPAASRLPSTRPARGVERADLSGYTASRLPGPAGVRRRHRTPGPGPAPGAADPRRRGPILFWFTLALIALGIGVLGTLDVAGMGVANSAYPAVAVGITGVMLLVGAF